MSNIVKVEFIAPGSYNVRRFSSMKKAKDSMAIFMKEKMNTTIVPALKEQKVRELLVGNKVLEAVDVFNECIEQMQVVYAVCEVE